MIWAAGSIFYCMLPARDPISFFNYQAPCPDFFGIVRSGTCGYKKKPITARPRFFENPEQRDYGF